MICKDKDESRKIVSGVVGTATHRYAYINEACLVKIPSINAQAIGSMT